MNWVKGPVRIAVEGLVKEGCPLAVTSSLDGDGTYTITHHGSGFGFGTHGLSVGRAMLLADKLAGLDWDFTDVSKMPEKTKRVSIAELIKAVDSADVLAGPQMVGESGHRHNSARSTSRARSKKKDI